MLDNLIYKPRVAYCSIEITLRDGIPAYAGILSGLVGKAHPHGMGGKHLATQPSKQIRADLGLHTCVR